MTNLFFSSAMATGAASALEHAIELRGQQHPQAMERYYDTNNKQ